MSPRRTESHTDLPKLQIRRGNELKEHDNYDEVTER